MEEELYIDLSPSIFKILGEEAEWNWRLFFDNIENEDYKDAFLETLAGYLTQVCYS